MENYPPMTTVKFPKPNTLMKIKCEKCANEEEVNYIGGMYVDIVCTKCGKITSRSVV